MNLYPSRYGTSMVSLDELKRRHHIDKMHPEFARRLFNWIEAQNGKVGIGGSWREDGSQPDKPGFAPEGKSFHQYQKFSSGVFFAAVDLVVAVPGKVHRAPRWDEVPKQDTADATRWGVHCNVSNEPWHMQPVEIDGWQSWINSGSPDLLTNRELMYPLSNPKRIYDTRLRDGVFKDNETRTIYVGKKFVHLHATVTGAMEDGYLSIAGLDGKIESSLVNYKKDLTNSAGAPLHLTDGCVRVFVNKACHVIIDIYSESAS